MEVSVETERGPGRDIRREGSVLKFSKLGFQTNLSKFVFKGGGVTGVSMQCVMRVSMQRSDCQCVWVLA